MYHFSTIYAQERILGHSVKITNFDDHFPASHVSLSLCGLLLSLVHHAVTCRPVFQCKVAHRLTECPDLHRVGGLLRVAEVLEKFAKPRKRLTHVMLSNSKQQQVRE